VADKKPTLHKQKFSSFKNFYPRAEGFFCPLSSAEVFEKQVKTPANYISFFIVLTLSFLLYYYLF